jgi:L-arabinose isomerase
MANLEMLLITRDTRLPEFKNELRWNDAYYRLGRVGL